MRVFIGMTLFAVKQKRWRMYLHFIVNFYLQTCRKFVNLRAPTPYDNNEAIRRIRVGITAGNADREYNYVEDYESYHLFLRPLQHAIFQVSAYTSRKDVSSM